MQKQNGGLGQPLTQPGYECEDKNHLHYRESACAGMARPLGAASEHTSGCR